MKSTLFLKTFRVITCFTDTSCTKENDPPTNGLILYYTFDGNVNDFSGNDNNGINYTTSNYVTGIHGQALDFNGTSDYVQLSYTINSERGLSLSFWLKTRGVNGSENNGAIMSKYNMTSNLRCFLIRSFGYQNTRIDNNLSATFFKYGYSSTISDDLKSYLETDGLNIYPNPDLYTLSNPLHLEIGVWTHCVVNTTSTSLEIWLNGELCTKKEREYIKYFDSSDEPVFIGNIMSGADGSNNHLNGLLDELRIYSRGLTTDEIRTLFLYK